MSIMSAPGSPSAIPGTSHARRSGRCAASMLPAIGTPSAALGNGATTRRVEEAIGAALCDVCAAVWVGTVGREVDAVTVALGSSDALGVGGAVTAGEAVGRGVTVGTREVTGSGDTVGTRDVVGDRDAVGVGDFVGSGDVTVGSGSGGSGSSVGTGRTGSAPTAVFPALAITMTRSVVSMSRHARPR